MSWKIPRIWEGGECWIIGGGQSMCKQFGIPHKIVQSVMKGESKPDVYSPYLSAIHKEHVIGINMSFQIGNWIDIMFFGDGSYFLNNKNQLAEFPGLKVCCDPKVKKYDWIKMVDRDLNKPRGLSSILGKVSWNGNSGAAAINFAVHLGCKKIMLLGFDMKLTEKNQQHWHNLYGRQSRLDDPKDKKIRNLPFDKHLRGFPFILEDAKKLGVEIINVNPDSAIECFRKVNLSDVL